MVVAAFAYVVIVSVQKSFPVKRLALLKKGPYPKLFWSAFSRTRTEYGEIRSISSYSVQMRENADQNNSEIGTLAQFLRI